MLNSILPWLFWSFEALGVFGTTPVILLFDLEINLKLGTSIGISKNYSHTKIVELFFEMMSFTIFATFCFLINFT